MSQYRLAGEVWVYLWQNKITRKKFCELCGISYTHFSKLMKEDFSVPLITIFKIAEVLKVEARDLLREKYY